MSERTPTSAPPVGPPKIGLVLPGGGARAAYQVGVLRAISDLLPARAINPFPVVSGTSAGAVNATAIAVHADRFRVAVGNLERVWRNFQVGQVFRADTVSMLRASLHWLLAMMSGGWLLPPPKSLFDNSPLRELLKEQFDFSRIGLSIEEGHLDALAMSTAGYASTRSVSFFQAKPGCTPWRRTRRAGEPTSLSVEHLMASVAVPFVFPPVLLGDEYYGDGAMREANPSGAAIHLGAQRLLVIGTRNEASPTMAVPPLCPTFGQIFGYMLDSLFSDGMYSDLERLTQLNQIVDKVGPITVSNPDSTVHLRRDRYAGDSAESRSVGDRAPPRRFAAADLARSVENDGRDEYRRRSADELLTVPGYVHARDDRARYQDAMKRSDDLMSFLAGYSVASTGATAILRRLDSRKEQRAEAQK